MFRWDEREFCTIKCRAHIGWPNEKQWNGVIFDSQLYESGCWFCYRAFNIKFVAAFENIANFSSFSLLFHFSHRKLAWKRFCAVFNKISKISSLFTFLMRAICLILFARSLSSMKHNICILLNGNHPSYTKTEVICVRQNFAYARKICFFSLSQNKLWLQVERYCQAVLLHV